MSRKIEDNGDSVMITMEISGSWYEILKSVAAANGRTPEEMLAYMQCNEIEEMLAKYGKEKIVQ